MIEFDNVQLAFNGKKVLNNLALRVHKGDKAVFLGRSGVGKSSLFSLLLGFIQADNGRVAFDGARIDEKHAWNVRQQVAYIDQDVSIPQGKLSDWIESVSGLKANASADFSQENLTKLMELFALDNSLLEKEVSELSGGERQRMAIVVAVMLKRQVYLLDEVTAALDKQMKKKVADFFLSNEEWTVLVISHDPIWLNHPGVRIFDLEAAQWTQ